MSFTIGVYDLFTYAIPGSLYAAVLLYITRRTGWVEAADLEAPGVTAFAVAAVGSYLLGHVTFGLTRRLERLLPWRPHYMTEARERFRARSPHAGQRPYIDLDVGVLRAAAEIHAKEGAIEIARLNAVSLMLRGCAPALVIAAGVAAVEVVTSDKPVFALLAAVAFVASAIAAVTRAWDVHRWAHMKALEMAYWIPGIDDTGP